MKTCDEDSDNATTENEVIEDVIIKGVEDDMKPAANKKIAGFKDEIVATKTADQDVKKQCVGGQDLEQDIISHKYDVRDENNCDTPTKLSGIIHKDTANLGEVSGGLPRSISGDRNTWNSELRQPSSLVALKASWNRYWPRTVMRSLDMRLYDKWMVVSGDAMRL